MIEKIRIRRAVDQAHPVRADPKKIFHVPSCRRRDRNHSVRPNKPATEPIQPQIFFNSRLPTEKKTAHVVNRHDVRIPHEQGGAIQREVDQDPEPSS